MHPKSSLPRHLNKFSSRNVLALPIAAAALALPTLAAASQLQVGPLRLGMTNSEVLKVAPLRSCAAEDGVIKCSSTIDVLGADTATDLVFDRRTKRLTEVSVRLLNWASDDARLQAAYADLNIKPCPSEMTGEKPTWFEKDECFAAPDQVRRVVWDGGREPSRRGHGLVRSITIELQQSRGYFRRFMEEKADRAKAARQEREAQSFAGGK